MSRVVFHHKKFKILQIGNSSYIVVRKYQTECNEHSHLSSLHGAICLIRLLDQNLMPKSRYLQESARRILKEKEYQQLQILN